MVADSPLVVAQRGDCLTVGAGPDAQIAVVLHNDGTTLTIKSPVPWYWRLRWWVLRITLPLRRWIRQRLSGRSEP